MPQRTVVAEILSPYGLIGEARHRSGLVHPFVQDVLIFALTAAGAIVEGGD